MKKNQMKHSDIKRSIISGMKILLDEINSSVDIAGKKRLMKISE